MPVKNKYAKRSKISESKFRELVRLFAYDLDATQISKVTNLNRNTVNRYLKGIRERIAEYCEEQSPFKGVVEVDESFFGPKRVKGRKGRGALGKTVVFGILKRQGSVYTQIVQDCTKSTLQAIIRGRVSLESVIHSDGLRSYHGLVDLGYKKHLRVDHGENEFAVGANHINGIESFWGFAKTRLVRFHGIHKATFYLHLKECEFRFNHRSQDMYQALLKLLRERPLF
jgi:transposase-like protein